MKQTWFRNWFAAGHSLLLLVAADARAQPPIVPESVKTTVRQRVDYRYCAGVVIGTMNTNGATYFSCGRVDLDGGPAMDETPRR